MGRPLALRVGDYRLIFQLRRLQDAEDRLHLYITHIGTRGDIY